MPYHEGELEMQRRAGAADLAQRVGRIIGTDIPAAAAAFLAAQRFVIASTVDRQGWTRASLLGGEAGFAQATSPRTVEITPARGHVRDVRSDIGETGVIGLLAIDFASRRRIRVNGQATLREGAIDVTTSEVYSNCPQYITPRIVHAAAADDAALSENMTDALTISQQRWIERADTFFLATAHPQRGPDASHRGGTGGFVRVVSPTVLAWPDYPGNNMFNSLGNLLVSAKAGLLFADFDTGETLQLRGSAMVHGDETRVVQFDIREVREIALPVAR